MRHVATLEELRRSWSIDDVLTANEYLDLQDDIAEHARRRSDAESKLRSRTAGG